MCEGENPSVNKKPEHPHSSVTALLCRIAECGDLQVQDLDLNKGALGCVGRLIVS